jgi:hypothetical protein
MKQPRRLCRSQQRLPYAAPLAEAVKRLRPRPGTITETRIWHARHCPRSQGGECTCKPHEIDIEVVNPERN